MYRGRGAPELLQGFCVVHAPEAGKDADGMCGVRGTLGFAITAPKGPKFGFLALAVRLPHA